MNNKRSRFFIDSAFQGRLLFRLFMYWFLYHVILWHTMLLLTLIGNCMQPDTGAPPKGFWTLYAEFAVDNLWLVICFLVMLPILGRDLIKFSHRIAGPLVRFRNAMQSIADGNPAVPVKLRERDLLEDFVAAYNNMVRTWNTRFGKALSEASKDSELEPVESVR